jgi:hypothetical protein
MNEVIALTNSGGGGGVADGYRCCDRCMLCVMMSAILPPSQNGSVSV